MCSALPITDSMSAEATPVPWWSGSTFSDQSSVPVGAPGSRAVPPEAKPTIAPGTIRYVSC